jgi:hypothetical protein
MNVDGCNPMCICIQVFKRSILQLWNESRSNQMATLGTQFLLLCVELNLMNCKLALSHNASAVQFGNNAEGQYAGVNCWQYFWW